jgi:hypothetical protein
MRKSTVFELDVRGLSVSMHSIAGRVVEALWYMVGIAGAESGQPRGAPAGRDVR